MFGTPPQAGLGFGVNGVWGVAALRFPNPSMSGTMQGQGCSRFQKWLLTSLLLNGRRSKEEGDKEGNKNEREVDEEDDREDDEEDDGEDEG